ncbi:MAG: type II toxin-antitoxin system Phd/YefM family antitoxin [Elusimicrobia bacterium]|nr:type II toxin-antitoxin system Phd/YefM family antitoxin [Elusimicrobiota bacterium]
MTHTITALKARQNLGEMLNRVWLKHDEFIIERGGKPMAAVIPIDRLEQIKAAARLFLSQSVRRIHAANKGVKVDADALADEAKHSARQRRRTGR